MPLSSALRILVCGLVPWHLRNADQSTFVATIYGLNSGVFLSTLLHMPYPNRGVVWRSIQSVFTRLLPRLLLVFLPLQDMCVCMLQGSAHHRGMDCFFPPEGVRIDYEGALSRRLHAYT